jgi:hypothetical protein
MCMAAISYVGLLFSILDQADWVPVAARLIRPIWTIGLPEAARVFGLAAAVPVPINLIGDAIGARESPM